jgi:DNA-binding NtrC family response regulator
MFTGHSENLTEEQAKAAGVREFLRKPLELDQVAHVIRRVLESP